MSELPQLDPMKLYQKTMAQLSELTAQAIQMDTMIEALVGERDQAIEERDKAQDQLRELTTKLSRASEAKNTEETAEVSEEEPALEGIVE